MTTWNPADKSATIVLSGGNLTATGAASAGGVRSTTSQSTGQIYWEYTVSGTAPSASTRGILANSTQSLTTAMGSTANSIGWLSNNGNVLINGTAIGTAVTYTTGDLLRIALDLTNNRIWVAKGAGLWNNSGTANPATNTGGFSLATLAAGPYFMCWGNAGAVNLAALVMDPTGAVFGAPSGFSTWDTSGVTGAAAWTEAPDIWAGAGGVLVSGTSAWTEPKDIWAGLGGIVGTGTVAWTEEPDIWAATGTISSGISGSAAWTEPKDVWSASGGVLVSGAGAWTENPDLWAAAGNVTLPAITGSASWTEPSDAWSAQGTNGAVSVGGHFIPLTEKQVRELKKRERRDRQLRDDIDQSRKMDAESIEADIRATLAPEPKATIIAQKTIVETEDEDEDLILILMHA